MFQEASLFAHLSVRGNLGFGLKRARARTRLAFDDVVELLGLSARPVLIAVAAVGIIVFVIWELPDKQPIVNLKVFRHRNFAAGTLALMGAYGSFFSVGLLVPVWLQRELH